jgi:hypothetical protein
MSEFKYGQGYSDWHKYAGYVDKNTDQFNFGQEPTEAITPAPIAPPETNTSTSTTPVIPPIPGMKPIDYSFPSTLGLQSSSLLDTFKSLGGY